MGGIGDPPIHPSMLAKLMAATTFPSVLLSPSLTVATAPLPPTLLLPPPAGQTNFSKQTGWHLILLSCRLNPLFLFFSFSCYPSLRPSALPSKLSVTGNWLPAVWESLQLPLLPLPLFPASLPPSLFLSLQLLRVPVADGKSGIMTRINYLHTSKGAAREYVCMCHTRASETMPFWGCVCACVIYMCTSMCVCQQGVCENLQVYSKMPQQQLPSVYKHTHFACVCMEEERVGVL